MKNTVLKRFFGSPGLGKPKQSQFGGVRGGGGGGTELLFQNCRLEWVCEVAVSVFFILSETAILHSRLVMYVLGVSHFSTTHTRKHPPTHFSKTGPMPKKKWVCEVAVFF